MTPLTMAKLRARSFIVLPYVGHKGWVGAYLDGKLFAQRIAESHGLIGPKKKR